MKNPQTTVIYYTSNREPKEFEQKIRDLLLEAIGGLPLISVSQKPIIFGKNICVGDVGVSNQNAHRQFQIGAMAATTPFIHVAEADTLYPKEYFQYLPPTIDRIYWMPIYLLYLNRRSWRRDRFYLKGASECSIVVGREYIINLIENNLNGRGMWCPERENGKTTSRIITSHKTCSLFNLKIPIISVKSGYSMHGSHECIGRTKILPYWGTPDDVIKLI